MRNYFPGFIFVFTILSAGEVSFAQISAVVPVQYFSTLPNITIRALEAVSDSNVWFAANHGVWGFSEDAGKSWHIDSIRTPTGYPEFRSIAVLNDSTVLLLSIASPAYLYRTTNRGKTWKPVYTNPDKDIFFDSMKFRDGKNGIAIADPIDGCFPLITTTDGGETWRPVDCANIPKAMEGEALFASSNTCLDLFKDHVWFATGGKKARVFHSSDSGVHFETKETPVAQGEKMAGIFSVDFRNDSTGIIAGGNYDKTDSSIISLALTKDGGRSWKEIKCRHPLFGSCVQFSPSTYPFPSPSPSPSTFLITGHNGTFAGSSKGELKEIKDSSGASLKFHTLRFSPSGKKIWMAGDKGRIALISKIK